MTVGSAVVKKKGQRGRRGRISYAAAAAADAAGKSAGNSGIAMVVDEKVLDEHPLGVGNYLVVKFRDGSHRIAKILSRGGENNSFNAMHY